MEILEARLNNELSALTVSSEDLARIQGYGTNSLSASYAEIVSDLSKMANNLAKNKTSIENLGFLINKLKQTDGMANDTRKGYHFIIRDLVNDVESFGGKKIRLEQSVPNAREGNASSSIDVFCIKCIEPDLDMLIEYKSGPGSINSTTIKNQFIERDLFNITNLNQLQWRLEGTGFTKSDLITDLNNAKSSIENLGYERIKRMFPNDGFMTSDNYVERFISKFDNESLFQSIFISK